MILGRLNFSGLINVRRFFIAAIGDTSVDNLMDFYRTVGLFRCHSGNTCQFDLENAVVKGFIRPAELPFSWMGGEQ
jgi:hypothetical protein